MIVLFLGGTRSGKSRLAKNFVESTSIYPRTVIATAIPEGDEEFQQRIERHKKERDITWGLIEQPFYIYDALSAIKEGIVLVDSIDCWVSNHLIRADSVGPVASFNACDGIKFEMEKQLQGMMELSRERNISVVFVSAEAGLSVVPDNRLARYFVDILGSLNQLIAANADNAYLCVAGKSIKL